jgi:hypothetical protein
LSESAHFSIRCMDCVRSHSRSTQQTTHNTQHTTHKANNTRRIERRQYARSPLSSAPCILLSLSLSLSSFTHSLFRSFSLLHSLHGLCSLSLKGSHIHSHKRFETSSCHR